MIRELKNDTMPQDKYDLADLQALILKFGPNHFNPRNNSPLQYFQVLIYSQQFERVHINDANEVLLFLSQVLTLQLFLPNRPFTISPHLNLTRWRLFTWRLL
jgi:hypothetical protein